MALPDLPDSVIRSPFHKGFFNRGLQDVDYDRLRIVKTYSSKSLFARSYGFRLGEVRHHCRYTFDELGLPTHFTLFNLGKIEFERPINFYRNKFTPNDVLISLANVVSGIYRVPVDDLYFDSLLADYVDGLPSRLLDFLKDDWNIDLSASMECDDFEELVGVMILLFKKEQPKDPRLSGRGDLQSTP